MKKIGLLITLSLCLSLLIKTAWPARSFDEQLIRVQAQHLLNDSIPTIEHESIELQSVLLDYSDDQILLLKTQVALLKFPKKTRQVLLQFGSEPVFIDILRQYGETIIPVINYFNSTDIIKTIKLRDDTKQLVSQIKSWWHEMEQSPRRELSPEQQARYAIQFIEIEGYDFLGQFHIDATNGKLEWIQTERFSESLSAFFSSGVKNLETRYVSDQEISMDDFLWAGVDVLAVAGSLKLLRASRQVAHSGKSLNITRQTTLFGSHLLKSGLAGKLFKYSSLAATGFIIIKHPSLIPSAFAEIGKLFGMPPLLAQFIGITLLLFIVAYPLSTIFKLFLLPCIKLLEWLSCLLIKTTH